MAKRTKPKPTPRIVRRTDVNGRSYFVHKETGAQRSRRAWELDLKRRKAQEKPQRRPPKRKPAPPPPPPKKTPKKKRRRDGGGGGAGGGGEPPPDVGHQPGDRPFPPGVSGTGMPEDLFDDEAQIPWFEVDDETDYEEGSGA